MWSSVIAISVIMAAVLGIGFWVSLGNENWKDGKSPK